MSVLVFAACGGAARPAPAPAPVIANATRTCAEAAAGLERATKSVRPPERSVIEAMRAHCVDDAWSVAAIACFADMKEGDLGRCAMKLADAPRTAMFGVIAGGDDDRAQIAIARARLEGLSVGVAECDRFVTAVVAVLACEQMPVATRAALGTETADFWDLPTSGLPADAQRRMSRVCGNSLQQIQQQALDAGCAP